MLFYLLKVHRPAFFAGLLNDDVLTLASFAIATKKKRKRKKMGKVIAIEKEKSVLLFIIIIIIIIIIYFGRIAPILLFV